MITDKQLELLGMQFHLLHDCIRSIIYFRVLTSTKDKQSSWVYVTDVLSDHLIQSWCKIFGSTGEATHWKKLAEKEEIKKIIIPYSKDNILHATSLSDEEWQEYHSSMLTARNEFFAHFDMDSMQLNYPNLDSALKTAISYREWLSDLLNAIAILAIKDGDVINNKALPTEDMLKKFNDEANTLCC